MSFADSLHRETAARGALDPFFDDLSIFFSRVSRQVFSPVGVIIAPRLTGDAGPGYMDIESLTAYLDSEELLGPEADLRAGRVEDRAILRAFGVDFHEVFHAIGTKLWVTEYEQELGRSEDPADRQAAIDMMFLEEPRMESVNLQAFDLNTRRGAFVYAALNAAVVDCIIPAKVEEMVAEATKSGAVSRDMAGNVAIYIRSRATYGVLDFADIEPISAILEQVLGADDLQALDDLFVDLQSMPHGEEQMLHQAALRYREIIGPPEKSPQPQGGSGQPGEGQGQGGGDGDGGGEGSDADGSGDAQGGGDGKGDESGSGSGSGSGGADGSDEGEGSGGAGDDAEQDASQDEGAGSESTVKDLADAIEAAHEAGEARGLEQYNENYDLQSIMAEARGEGGPMGKDKGPRGTGAPTGRMPDLGVNRMPTADEMTQADGLAHEMQRALIVGSRLITSRRPQGKFSPKRAIKGQFQRAMGLPVKAEPWVHVKELKTPLRAPHVLLVIDTSGSMNAYEYALGPICWILTSAFAQLDARVATMLFGNGLEVLSDGTRQMELVPGIATGGGTAFAGDAIVRGAEMLEFGQDAHRPDMIYIISDGGWMDTKVGTAKIRELSEQGIPTMHISIVHEPLCVEAERITVIDDPADVYDIVARDTIDVLREHRIAR